MRVCLLVLALLGLVACAACGGGAGSLNTDVTENAGSTQVLPDSTGATETPASGLADIPRPREVSAGNELADSTRSYLMRMGAFYTSLQGQGSELVSPERYLRLQAMSDGMLPYEFTLIQRVRTATSKPGKVSFELSWEGAEPADSEGLFIGYADTVANHWVWRGPVRNSSDMVDFSSLGVEVSDDWRFEDTLAMVNFSSTPVVIKHVFYTKIDANDTKGDEYLFYSTIDLADRTEQIHRAPANALDQAVVIFTTEPFERIGRMQVVNSTGQELLIFNRFTQAGKWEAWQMGVDGSDPQVRRAMEFGDIQHSSFSEDLTKEFYFVNNWCTNNLLQEVDVATNEMTNEFDLLTFNASNPLWYNRGGYDCRMLLSLPEASGAEHWGLISYISAEFLGGGALYQQRVMTSGEDIVDPFRFDWAMHDSASLEYILYSYKAAPQDNYSIVLFGSQSSMPREQCFVAMDGYDLRYPQMSPDQLCFSVVATGEGGTYGTLYVMPAFARAMDPSYAIADNVSSSIWYDPTPPSLSE